MAYSQEQWERAKAYYEAGTHTLQRIEDEVGINKGHLSRTAKKQQWQQGSKADYIEARVIIAEKKATEKATTLQILDDIADDIIRHKRLVYSIQEKALQKAEMMLDQIDTPSDLKTIVEAVDKASITLKVSERHAKSGDVNVQTNTAVQTNLDIKNISEDDLKEMAGRYGIILEH